MNENRFPNQGLTNEKCPKCKNRLNMHSNTYYCSNKDCDYED